MTTATLRHKTKQKLPKPPKMWSVEEVKYKLLRLQKKEVANCGVHSRKLEEKKAKLILKITHSAALLPDLQSMKVTFEALERKSPLGRRSYASLPVQILAQAIETRLVSYGMRERAA